MPSGVGGGRHALTLGAGGQFGGDDDQLNGIHCTGVKFGTVADGMNGMAR